MGILGNEILKKIAQELVDWGKRENARVKLRVLVMRILRKYVYPPDKQERAADFVIE